VQEAGAGLSISAVASGNFSFAPKTAIVVNLELMAELQALDSVGQLSAATFADAVLRSQPNFLVHGLLPLLEPAAPQMGAVRSKLIADGTLFLLYWRRLPCHGCCLANTFALKMLFSVSFRFRALVCT
jgi:hypothetical protein